MLKYIEALICAIDTYIYCITNNKLILACAILMGLCVIIETIKEKKFIVKHYHTEKSVDMEIKKHGSYYYTETCPVCGCIFNFNPHKLNFSYNETDDGQEIRKEWIYCPECAHKFEWDEGYHQKLNY